MRQLKLIAFSPQVFRAIEPGFYKMNWRNSPLQGMSFATFFKGFIQE
jgi:hypothetical protein